METKAFIASSGLEVKLDRTYTLQDGSSVSYYSVDGWSFSSLEDEDNDIEYVKKSIAAWQAWLEFLESGGLVDNL